MERHETRMLSMSVSGENGLAGHHWRHQFDAAYRSRLPNVNPELTHLNVTLSATTDRDAYDARFGEALAAYNASQSAKGHPERRIPDYLAKLTDARATDERKVEAGKKKKVTVVAPFIDYVVQVGSHETVGKLDNAEYEAIYGEAFERIQERSMSDGGGIDWCQAVIHFDEEGGTPHLHISGIPFATGCKRGLETQASLGGALKALDLADKPALAEMVRDELEDVCERHGILRDVMGSAEGRRSTREFKREQRELAEVTAKRVEASNKLAQVTEATAAKQAELAEVTDALEGVRPIKEAKDLTLRPFEKHRRINEGREAEGRLGALESEVERARERAEGLEGQRDAAERRIEDLRRDVAEAEREVRAAEHRNRRLEGVLGKLAESIRALAEGVRRLGTQVATALVTTVGGRRAKMLADGLGIGLPSKAARWPMRAWHDGSRAVVTPVRAETRQARTEQQQEREEGHGYDRGETRGRRR